MTVFRLDRKKQLASSTLVWCLSFLYALVAGLTLQKLVLPLVPSLHAGHGLLHQDALHYHLVAVQLAERIQAIGWSEWRLFPAIGGGTGNVGLLSALYVWFGPNPAWFLPFAAAAHATGATVLSLLGPVLWPGRVGRVGGMAAAALFVLYPSSMLSYGQNYKDPFSIAGTLLVVYGFLCAVTASYPVRIKRILAAMTAGILLMWCVRPYVLFVVSGGLVAALVIMAVNAGLRHRWASEKIALARGMVCIVLILAVAWVLPKGRNQEGFNAESIVNSLAASSYAGWEWKSSRLVPASIDEGLKRLSVLRVGFAAHGASVGAGSQIDADRIPDNAGSALAYMPRAAIVGLLAPFPSSWTDKVSLFRVVGAMETALWYLLIPGLLWAVMARPSSAMLSGMIACGILIMFYSYIQPNVGTLYRVRGGPLFFFILCGAIGWARIGLTLLSYAHRRCRKDVSSGALSRQLNIIPSITDVSAAGIAVVFLTAVWYFGFLVRDLLLVNIYGLGGQLDGFLSASMIPMFLVGVLVLPLADALTAPFIQAGRGGVSEEAARLARSFISFAVVLVGVAAVGLVAAAEWIVPWFVSGRTPHDVDEGVTMLRWFSLLLALSAWTVVGNGVLNAVNRPLAAAVAQLCVPVVTIVSILACSEPLGLRAAIAGMIVGTFLNASIAWYFSSLAGAPLIPLFPGQWSDLSCVYRNYIMLAIVALLVGLTIPINLAFAARLEPGAVTAWALGGKLVQLLAGLAAVASAAVLTPHFGRLLAFRRSAQLAGDVYFVVTACTWLSILTALVLFAFLEPLVLALFQGAESSEEQASRLAGILRVGSLQIPFVVAMTLIIKLAAVSRQSSRAVAAVTIGVAINLILNVLLLPVHGLYGIAVATVAGSACSAAYMIVAMRRHCGFDWAQVLLLNASWLTMFGLAVGLSYQNGVAIVLACVSMLVVLAAQWHAWQRGGEAALRQPIIDSKTAELAA
ncbi:MAG: polysaccharide biosynthesis C-terminal domain-containing protein [Nitrospiraceae bacterium]|jgi:peptidoglycan biosynthesis protein MviN/MurJ (putative lipid II flippase)|nr:polysaccharide biosynthesis C-terminal domain-containing protein [Nitrospiraceae bacterium]